MSLQRVLHARTDFVGLLMKLLDLRGKFVILHRLPP